MPTDAEALDLSAIRETETSLILTLPTSRKKKSPLNNNGKSMFGPAVLLCIAFGMIAYGFSKEPAGVLAGGLLGIYAIASFIYTALYLNTGKDILEINAENITISYGIWPNKSCKTFEAKQIQHLRCHETIYYIDRELLQKNAPILKGNIDPTTYAITCIYAGETTSLLGWVDKSLAEYVVSRIKSRFKAYRK